MFMMDNEQKKNVYGTYFCSNLLVSEQGHDRGTDEHHQIFKFRWSSNAHFSRKNYETCAGTLPGGEEDMGNRTTMMASIL